MIKWTNNDDGLHQCQAEKLIKWSNQMKSNDQMMMMICTNHDDDDDDGDDDDDDPHQVEKLMWRDKAFSSWTPPL